MKKKAILISLIIMALLISMCGCGQAEIDISAMANSIKQQVDFDDELSKVPPEVVSQVYSLENKEIEIVSYIGSGATAEEITVFDCKDNKKSKEVYNLAESHIEQQKQDFENYNPKELKKLNNSIVIKKDKYVIVCVTNDNENANKVINDNLK